MKKVALITTLAIALLGITTAHAQTRTPGITHNQIEQHQRIKHGVAQGELTRPEAARLKMQQAKIQHHKRVAKSDGVVTPRERAYIQSEQARANRQIYRQKHDCQGR